MREVVVSATTRRPSWGYSGAQSKSTISHTVARACVAARREPDALVIIDDASVTPEETLRLVRQRAAKDDGVKLTVGMWKRPGEDTSRPYVTAAVMGAAT